MATPSSCRSDIVSPLSLSHVTRSVLIRPEEAHDNAGLWEVLLELLGGVKAEARQAVQIGQKRDDELVRVALRNLPRRLPLDDELVQFIGKERPAFAHLR